MIKNDPLIELIRRTHVPRGVTFHYDRPNSNQFGPTMILGSNKIILGKKLVDWGRLGVNFKEVAEGKVFLFRPAKIRNKTKNKLLCRIATDADFSAMYFLWKQYSANRNLTRVYPDLWDFSKSYINTPGVSINRTLLVFDGVSLVAMFSLWDQSSIHRIVVTQKSMFMRVVSRFITLPEVGEELKVIFSFQHAYLENHPLCGLALENLIAKARTISHKMGAQLFSIGLDRRDSLFQLFQKSATLANSVKIILDLKGNPEFEASTSPIHLEVGMG